MLCRYVALVSETNKVSLGELSKVAAAIQKQVMRDFAPIWQVKAGVAAFAHKQDVPSDYWVVAIRDNLDRPEAAGYHENEKGQPSASVRWTDDWTVTASHEALEMLADPWGRHMIAGPSPNETQGPVNFLVEVCDPCSDVHYLVDGVAVSDFYTPNFFDPVEASAVRYSYTGSIPKPRAVLKGGYLTWHVGEAGEWWHRSWFSGDRHIDQQVPQPHLVTGNLRAAIDRQMVARHRP